MSYFDFVKQKNTINLITKELDCLTTLSINVSDICNKKCCYCPHSSNTYNKNYGDMMSIETANDIAYRLTELKKEKINPRVTISGMGEPFTNPNLKEIIQILSQFNPNIITNGTIQPAWAKGLDSTITVIVSVHDIHQLDELKEKWPHAIFRNHDPHSHTYELITTNRNNFFKQNICYKGKCYCIFYKMMIDCDGSYLKCAEDWDRKSKKNKLNVKTTSIETWFTKIIKPLKESMVNGGRESIYDCKYCNINGKLIGEKAYEWFIKNGKRTC